MSQAFQAQVISMIFEGIFDLFPDLKVVLIEGGFAWVPPLMWRMDKTWQRLGDEVPMLKKMPSEYVREHFWISTQPIEEPPKRQYFTQMVDQLGMDDRLMFATDYPHWDFDAPDRAIPYDLGPERRHKIMAENARALYHL